MGVPRVLVVIGQVLVDPWLTINRNGQMRTWLGDALPSGFSVRHSFARRPGPLMRIFDSSHEWLRWHGRGRSLVPRIDGAIGRRWLEHVQKLESVSFAGGGLDAWSQGMPDIYALQRWKVVGSLTMAMQEEFDFIYFTTASSYVRLARLAEFVAKLPDKGVYAGTAMEDSDSGVTFASGASRIMSRDVVTEVLREKRHYRNDVLEDVGLGRLIGDLGYPLIPWPSVNVPSMQELDALTDTEILDNFHFRMTSGTRKARHDVPLMHALHGRILSLEGSG